MEIEESSLLKKADGEKENNKRSREEAEEDRSKRRKVNTGRTLRISEGGDRIGFNLYDKSEDGESVKKIVHDSFGRYKAQRKEKKEKFKTDRLSRLKRDNRETQDILRKEYPEVMKNTPFSSVSRALGEMDSFETKRDGDKMRIYPKKKESEKKEASHIATLYEGKEAFDKMKLDTRRRVYAKRGFAQQQQYVPDNREVATRRDAAVEKNFYQFMEFLTTGEMEGRFQMLNKALTGNSDRVDPTQNRGNIANPLKFDHHDDMNWEQTAVLHQYMGNGIQQSGNSLTSTLKEGAVFSNDGDSFREKDGVRMLLDLAQVPENVQMMNLYSKGGVKDSLRRKVRANDDGTVFRNYGFKSSVEKNRELYLESIKPEYLKDIEVHTGSDVRDNISVRKEFFPGQEPSGQDLMATAGKLTGHESYLEGFKQGIKLLKDANLGEHEKLIGDNKDDLTNAHYEALAKKNEESETKPTETADLTNTDLKEVEDKEDPFQKKLTELGLNHETIHKDAFKKGLASARLYLQGHKAGKGKRNERKRTLDFSDMNDAYRTNTEAKPIHWLGWAHGAAEKEPASQITKDFYADPNKKG